MRPTKLLPILGVPGTGAALTLKTTTIANREPYEGWLEAVDGRIVGQLDKFRFRFVDFSESIKSDNRAASAITASERVSHFLGPFDPRIKYVGNWRPLGPYLMVNDGDSLQEYALFETSAVAVEIKLHSHHFSGVAHINDGLGSVREIDLYRPETATPVTVLIENPKKKKISIIVKPAGKFNPSAQGRQLIVEGYTEYDDALFEPEYRAPEVKNRDGDFRPRFFEIANTLGENTFILDIGGGRRQLDDSRYINLEYSPYDEPTMFGDALALPFKNNSIDFVHSTAMLEHVKDPMQAAREMHRVLKPGGRLLANCAFMQPVHSEGQHFFNATPYGMEHLFSMFDNKSVYWDGSLSDAVLWMIEETRVKHKVPPTYIDALSVLLKGLDEHVTYDRLMYVASGVWVEATK